MKLLNQSIHKLRSIAQGYGIHNLFGMDKNSLVQAIELKQHKMFPVDQVTPKVQFIYATPDRPMNKDGIKELLEAHIEKGLNLSFPDADSWQMSFRNKEDAGSMTMPVWSIVACAERLMG